MPTVTTSFQEILLEIDSFQSSHCLFITVRNVNNGYIIMSEIHVYTNCMRHHKTDHTSLALLSLFISRFKFQRSPKYPRQLYFSCYTIPISKLILSVPRRCAAVL